MDCCSVSAAICGAAANAVEFQKKQLAIIGEFDSIHSYCQPCDVEVSKAINTGLSSSSNTTQDAQLAIGQQIGVLQTQLTGLMTKFNEHINFCFQQVEEKLSNS